MQLKKMVIDVICDFLEVPLNLASALIPSLPQTLGYGVHRSRLKPADSTGGFPPAPPLRGVLTPPPPPKKSLWRNRSTLCVTLLDKFLVLLRGVSYNALIGDEFRYQSLVVAYGVMVDLEELQANGEDYATILEGITLAIVGDEGNAPIQAGEEGVADLPAQP